MTEETRTARPNLTSPRPRWGVILGLWSIPAILGAAERTMLQAEAGEPILGSQLLMILFFWYSWALATPIVLALSRRAPVAPPRRLGAILIHGLAGSLLAVFMSSGLSLLELLLPGENQAPLSFANYFALLGRSLAMGYLPMLMLYSALVAVGMGLELRRRYREGLLRSSQLETRTAELERRLVESRLETLRMQIQPHFLFNTLHAISALMDHNVPAARRMIARLSELLRMTLSSEGPQEVPLEREIEALERYLDIERVRLGDRLRVDYDIADDALEVPVPSLILQPLVENAVRYGVAPVARPGRIRIAARRDGAMLRLVVADDGPGRGRDQEDGNGQPAREGIGLTNTRARLAQLYGAAGQLELVDGADRGLEVRLSLPIAAANANDANSPLDQDA